MDNNQVSESGSSSSVTIEGAPTAENQFFSVSITKLRNLYLLTLGLYSVYWFYKHWKLQQPFMEKQIMPVARAIFSIFFTHSLARRIKTCMQKKNMPESRNLIALAILFVALVISSNIVSMMADSKDAPFYLHYTWLVLFYFSAYPLVEMQDKVNHLKGDPMGTINSEYSWHNIVFMVIGGFFWFILILGILAMSLNGPVQ